MKNLKLTQMEILKGGTSDTGCLVSGFFAGATLIVGFINPMAWVGTAAITSSAANAGCFD